MSKIKVLQMGKFYPPSFGGIEQVVYDITKGINGLSSKYCCDVLCFNHDTRKGSKTDYSDGAEIYRMNTIGVISSAPISLMYFLKFIKIKGKYDIIHLHAPNPVATIAALFARNKTIIIHWHSDIVKQKRLLKLFLPIQKQMLNRASKIIVTSDNYGRCSEQLFGFERKIMTIPIGIPSDKILIPKKYVSKNKKIIFSLGRLIYYKGFEYLIEAAKYLPENYMIIIGGTGPLYSELQKKIDDNRLNNKVRLVGRIPMEELQSYYESADLFCMPSIEKSEAFGVVQLEAMKHGIPVVSTRIPGSGVSWVNLNEVSGLTVPVKNSQALSEAFMNILENESLYKHLSNGALRRYNENFTSDKMCRKIIELYDEL
ncbi:glycosyltransferase [Escherichia albertii]|uniref:glycosyltransferase n=1 Tax=Escherichia albertii TaxID=208962 RepID=UPI0018D5A580|nr:glycosyltransferase [Escherichia albertii]MCZ9276090.1 glycosyltransferase [Escherichia albertii]